MKQMIALALAAGLAAVPQAASAQDGGHKFSVTNATSRTLACGVSERGSARMDLVVLRPGQEWSVASDNGRPRTWVCEAPARPTRYRLHSGMRYRLVEHQGSGWVILTGGRQG